MTRHTLSPAGFVLALLLAAPLAAPLAAEGPQARFWSAGLAGLLLTDTGPFRSPHPEGVDFSVGLVVLLRQVLTMYGPLLSSLAALAGGTGLAGLIVGIAISPDIEWSIDRATITRRSRFRTRTAQDVWPLSTVVRIRPDTLWTRQGPRHRVMLHLIDKRTLVLPVDTEDEADALVRAVQRLAGIEKP